MYFLKLLSVATQISVVLRSTSILISIFYDLPSRYLALCVHQREIAESDVKASRKFLSARLELHFARYGTFLPLAFSFRRSSDTTISPCS